MFSLSKIHKRKTFLNLIFTGETFSDSQKISRSWSCHWVYFLAPVKMDEKKNRLLAPVYVCIFMYVCIYIFMGVFICLWMYLYTYGFIYILMDGCIYIFMDVARTSGLPAYRCTNLPTRIRNTRYKHMYRYHYDMLKVYVLNHS
jgi:hypothetical protein